MMLKVELTKKQAEFAEWAKEPMQLHWGPTEEDPSASEADEEKAFAPEDVIRVAGTTLYINSDDDILADLRYRLLEQLHDMINDQIGFPRDDGKGRYDNMWAHGQYRVAGNLWHSLVKKLLNKSSSKALLPYILMHHTDKHL